MTAEIQKNGALGSHLPPLVDRRALEIDAGEGRGVGEEQKVAPRRSEAALERAGAGTYVPLEGEGRAFDRPSPGHGYAPQSGGARRHDGGERREGKPAGPGA
jgi:hypothetical protein